MRASKVFISGSTIIQMYFLAFRFPALGTIGVRLTGIVVETVTEFGRTIQFITEFLIFVL
jgi:hypothetical protein